MWVGEEWCVCVWGETGVWVCEEWVWEEGGGRQVCGCGCGRSGVCVLEEKGVWVWVKSGVCGGGEGGGGEGGRGGRGEDEDEISLS